MHMNTIWCLSYAKRYCWIISFGDLAVPFCVVVKWGELHMRRDGDWTEKVIRRAWLYGKTGERYQGTYQGGEEER